MLKYNHIYNETILSEDHNIAAITCDSYNVAIYVNDKLQEIVSPNVVLSGNQFNIFKNKLSDTDIVNLIFSGSNQEYTLDIEKLIYSKLNTIYVKNLAGNYLYTDSLGNTSWDSSNKTRFFFNPYYFDSDYLWSKLFKKKPDGVDTSGLWDLASEIDLFNRLTIEVDMTSIPSMVAPKKFSYFDQTAITETIQIDKFIKINAQAGDTVKLKTDKESLEFTYLPITSTAQMIIPDIDGTSISRPLIHIPVHTINPNSDSLYTKILNVGLNTFTLSKTIQGVTFNKVLNITRT